MALCSVQGQPVTPSAVILCLQTAVNSAKSTSVFCNEKSIYLSIYLSLLFTAVWRCSEDCIGVACSLDPTKSHNGP